MILINDEFFDVNNKDELKKEELVEKTYVCDMIKKIRVENIKEVKENNKNYEIILKNYRNEIINLIDNTEYETELSKYIVNNRKLKII
jgi:hypothetical protein